MQPNIFTVVPNKINTDHLYQLTREIICQKLASIIQQIGQQLQIELTPEVNRFNAVTPGILNPIVDPKNRTVFNV